MKLGKTLLILVLILAFHAENAKAQLIGPPVLRSVNDIGNSTARVGWANFYLTPTSHLGLAWDIYASDWVRGGTQGSHWYQYSYLSSFGDMPLGHTGGYYIWIYNYYVNTALYPCNNPWAGIVYSGTPHTPLSFSAVNAGNLAARAQWKPDAYGTWTYWVIAYNLTAGDWAFTQGPLGLSQWHYVLYGSQDFFAGSTWLTFPSTGEYVVYLAAVGWDGVTWSGFATTTVSM